MSGLKLETDRPRLIYARTPNFGKETLNKILYQDNIPFEHSFVLADFNFWGDPNTNVWQELEDWLADNIGKDDYFLQGSIASFRREEDAILFKATWG